MKMSSSGIVCLVSYDPSLSIAQGHCCERMTEVVNYRCQDHSDPFDCPDSLVYYEPRFAEYGIIVHDGGSCYALLSFCPFCGKKLPESKRNLWFEELGKRGVHDPWIDTIPEEFRTGEWYDK